MADKNMILKMIKSGRLTNERSGISYIFKTDSLAMSAMTQMDEFNNQGVTRIFLSQPCCNVVCIDIDKESIGYYTSEEIEASVDQTIEDFGGEYVSFNTTF